ncbi:ParA family protein [Haematospirillum jordaniae]|uniref:ParA family partition ATPase n=1 Tax=Haematospirillum jordaniae TaxID=1549855 RepID=UPI001432A3E5|nr:ParA family partition ATPase [Haematospirillum jordaniae]NKD84778.1 ParA family protein [Haematospirillum jordaniae]
MTGKIITVAQQKGGSGKTTLTAQLAVAWRQKGRKVALVDIDPQGSLSAWHSAREASNAAGDFTLLAVPGWRLGSELEVLCQTHDIVLIDSPPHAESEVRIVIRNASLVILPVQPSPMDLWAIEPTIDIAAREKTPVLLVLNRVPPKGQLSDKIADILNRLPVVVSKNRLGNRVAFASSMMEGKGVMETARRSLAAREISALAREILSHLSASSKKV